MYQLIRFAGGVVVEAVALAVGKNRIRVVAAGLPDTLELRYSRGSWRVEGRKPVEIDFVMPVAQTVETVSASTPKQAAFGAGHGAEAGLE